MAQNYQNQFQNNNNMNGINNMNMNNNSENISTNQNTVNSNNTITVVFRNTDSNGYLAYQITCTKDDRLSDVIQKYRNKSGDNDQSKKFIFNARNIDENVTVGQLKLTEGSIIFVVSTSGIKGGL